MEVNGYELYRMRDDPKLQQYMLRPYRYLKERNFTVRIDCYDMMLQGEIRGEENVKELRIRLEEELSDGPGSLCINIGDVIAVTKDGITAAYYVDPTRLILIPDFCFMPADGSIITVDTENCLLDGRKGSWMTVDSLMIGRRLYFLMQSLDYGRDAPYVIVDEKGRENASDRTGFTEDVIEQIRKTQEVLREHQPEPASDHERMPKLELWQQYFENGEYLRAAEISEEQNYNMIDGTANNRAPKRSIIERLQEKQGQIADMSITAQEQYQTIIEQTERI